MPRTRVTGVIVSEVWDDDSETKLTLEHGAFDDSGKYVSINDDGQTIYIKETSWSVIRDQIDGLFKESEE